MNDRIEIRENKRKRDVLQQDIKLNNAPVI